MFAVTAVSTAVSAGPAGTRTQLGDVTWTDARDSAFGDMASKYHIVFGALKRKAAFEVQLELDRNLVVLRGHIHTSELYGVVVQGTVVESEGTKSSEAQLTTGAMFYEPAKTPYDLTCATTSAAPCVVLLYFPTGFDFKTKPIQVKDIVQPVHIDKNSRSDDEGGVEGGVEGGTVQNR